MAKPRRKVDDLNDFYRGKKVNSGVRMRGFYRVNLVEHEEDGHPRIVGDSGWCENRVVQIGLQQYLAFALIGSAGSKFVSRGILGTGTVPATSDTSLPGEFGNAAAGSHNRPAAATQTNFGAGGTVISVQYAFTWASVNGFNTLTNRVIQNIGLINDTTTGGSIFAGNTFQTSTLSSNQDVQASYVVGFTTT